MVRLDSRGLTQIPTEVLGRSDIESIIDLSIIHDNQSSVHAL